MYRLGIDGGGSRCRARLCDETGTVLAEADGGSANVYLDFAGALDQIRKVVDAAFGLAGLTRRALLETRAGLGLAGVSSAATAAEVKAALPAFAHAVVAHDGIAACFGAHAGHNGGIVITGTGSVALFMNNGRASSIGGRGFVLGDDGSGANIGRQAWRRALRVLDGLEPSSPLAEALLDHHGRDAVAIIGWARDASSRSFASFAPRVFQAAAERDAIAVPIVTEAAAAIDELIAWLVLREAPRISLVGGLSTVIEPYLSARSAAVLNPPLSDAMSGALLLAERTAIDFS